MADISTGPVSKNCDRKAFDPVELAIAMTEEMGGIALKYYTMGLACREELIAVARACAEQSFTPEPTGGITLENVSEILKIVLEVGVERIIPHVYVAVIDRKTGDARPEDVAAIMNTVRALV